ncbi:MAG: hypothetical protein NTV55_06560 [Planctomycetota bacterium]|nr:hypothetical protein [Planctomycetota bacterium]
MKPFPAKNLENQQKIPEKFAAGELINGGTKRRKLLNYSFIRIAEKPAGNAWPESRAQKKERGWMTFPGMPISNQQPRHSQHKTVEMLRTLPGLTIPSAH